MKATNGITMMFRVHGAEEIGGGFVVGLVLSAAPIHEEAVAETPKHSHDAHGLWFADPALVLQMRDVWVLVWRAVQTDFAGVQVEFPEEFAYPGDFIGLGVHDGAAQVVLVGHPLTDVSTE